MNRPWSVEQVVSESLARVPDVGTFSRTPGTFREQ